MTYLTHVFLVIWVFTLNSIEKISAVPPPQKPPSELVDQYSLNGSIQIESFYVDDTNNGESTHFSFSNTSITSYISGATKIFNKIGMMGDRLRANNKSTDGMMFLFPKDQWIHVAMHKYKDSFVNSSVVVYGSMNPWVEAATVALDASKVTTVEYNTLTYNHTQMNTINKSQFESFYDCTGSYVNSFDIAISLSAFDHDGLGRYGDPLNPEGDLHAMKRVLSVLKPGGLFFLTVPIGPDVVVFNLHRRYGVIRLPLLLEGWDEVERIGWMESKITADANWRQSFEPIIVLRKPLGDLNVCNAVF